MTNIVLCGGMRKDPKVGGGVGRTREVAKNRTQHSSSSRPGELELHSRPPYWLSLAQERIPRLSEGIRRTKSTANKNHPPPKKHKSGTSGQATPSYNRNKFTSLEREERYNTLLQWTFVPKRWWGTLTSPHNKFDPDVVREFYANAYPPEEGGGLFEHKSWVRDKVIRYDRDYLNLMLNNPYEVSEDSMDGYHQMVAQNNTMAHGFRIAETVETLCLPGRSVSANVDG
ncbi:hypothetical protein Lal_00012769 [Lupinus albus]|nr:hypothetical protein Lal_00012769 [Lupinus albus]